MKAPVGAEVGITYYSDTILQAGEYLQTKTGRAYLIASVRVQQRGEYAGIAKHLRCIVIDPKDIAIDVETHPLVWDKR